MNTMLESRLLYRVPRVGSGLESVDPLRFVAGCRKSGLNQAMSVLSLFLGFFSECVNCAVN